MRLSRFAVLILAALVLDSLSTSAQTGEETFTANAKVTKGSVSASAPVRVSVTHYATEAERDVVVKTVREGGTQGLRKALSATADVGMIQVGDRRTPLKFALVRQTSGGRLLTLVTAEPILHLGAGLPSSAPVDGYDVAVAILEVIDGGGGMGDLSPAAKVSIDDGGAVTISDYGATVVWLMDIARAR